MNHQQLFGLSLLRVEDVKVFYPFRFFLLPDDSSDFVKHAQMECVLVLEIAPRLESVHLTTSAP